MSTGHWITANHVDDAYGFIYMITEIDTGRFYIGKKQMQKEVKLPPLKGYKRKRKKVVETDWKTYMSSSNYLLSLIEDRGKEYFKFEILRYCTCKWELAYWEAKEQFDRDVILTNKAINGIINLRIPKAPKNLLRD